MVVKPDDGDLSLILRTRQGVSLELERGDYRMSTPVTLDEPLSLKGAGMFQTRIVGTLILAKGGTLAGLSLEQGATCQGGALKVHDCRFRGGLTLLGFTEARLEECHFDQNEGHGLMVREKARCHAEKCQFTGNKNYGALFEEDASGRLSQCEASQNGSGFGVHGQASVELYKNYCHDHPSGMGISCGSSGAVKLLRNECDENVSGIELRDQTRAVVERNECSKNALAGLCCFDQSAPLVRNNSCRSNGQAGLQAWEQSRPRFENNFAWGNGEAGLSFHESAAGTALANQASNNRVGIAVSDKACPDLTCNECSGNGCGLAYYDQSCGTATSNRSLENEGIGIQVGDSAAPLLIENRVSRNQGYGIAFMQSARGLARDNHCWQNEQSDRVVVLEDANPQLRGNQMHRPGTGLLERVRGLFGGHQGDEDFPVGPEPDSEELRELTDLPRFLQEQVIMMAPQDLMEAVRRAGQRCRDHPGQPQPFLDYARALQAMESASPHPDPDWTRARAQALELALQRGVPEELPVRLEAARARSRLGDPACLEHYRAAVALQPAEPEANAGLVEWLRQTGEVQEAARVGLVALERCPEAAELHYQLALALERTGADAREAYARSLELRSDYRVENDFGVHLFLRGHYEEALGHIRQALALRPDDRLARLNLDRCLARIDELSTAAMHGRTASPSLLFCPTCAVPMDPLLVREVELDRCWACGGLWFDAGELKQVLGRMDSPSEVLDPPAEAPERARRAPGERVCCRCKLKLDVAMCEHVEVDACQACGGVFLDQGELGQLWGRRGQLLEPDTGVGREPE